MSERKQVTPGILLISTGKYKSFVQDLVRQIDSYFLCSHEKTIFLFTDEWQRDLESENLVVQILIPSYRFPYATLYRYKIFTDYFFQLQRCSHLYYFDVDMAIMEPIDDEFIVDGLLAVRHPGFYANNGWGDSNNPHNSKSFLPKEEREKYFCGGVQGGASSWYLMAAEFMAKGIEEDERIGVMAEWNDETFWNHYLHTQNVPITEFTPEYCIPEQKNLRFAWGINELPVKILALEKDHKKIRE